jgi:hypothetical protein
VILILFRDGLRSDFAQQINPGKGANTANHANPFLHGANHNKKRMKQ